MDGKKGTRNGDNGDLHKRKIDWMKLIWIPLAFMLLGGGSFAGFSLTSDTSQENEHKIEMLQQEVRLELKPMKERLKRIEMSIDKIADKLDAK